MAHYILVTTEGDTQTVTHVEAKNMSEATRRFYEEADDDVPDEATIYRVAAAPRKVRLKTVTQVKVEIE